MANWRRRRQATYGLIIFLGILILIGVPTYLYFDEEPTCTDGKQNGIEEGVDCGGDCPFACVSSLDNPSIVWSRSFKVSEGVYNSVAYINNPNTNVYARSVPYKFRLFDSENLLIIERSGRADILPGKTFPIFEGSIFTGERTPQTTFFEFGGVEWLQDPPDTTVLSIKDRVLERDDRTRLRAIIQNDSFEDLKDVEIIAIIFDKEENAIASSKTLIEKLSGNEEREIVFTWPSGFEGEVARIEIFPKLDI